jgi:mannitol/fructose-specific phosphotransferase system IIA component (Ntr-type)
VTEPTPPLVLDLSPYLSTERVVFLAAGETKSATLRRLAELTGCHPAVHAPAAFIAAIFEREDVSCTGIGGGIAVPHAKLATVDGFVLTVGISPTGIDYDAKDRRPVHLVVMIAASDADPTAYLKVLAAVAARLKRPEVISAVCCAKTPADVLAALA